MLGVHFRTDRPESDGFDTADLSHAVWQPLQPWLGSELPAQGSRGHALSTPLPFREIDFVGTIGSAATGLPFPFPFCVVEPPFNIAFLLAGPSAANALPSCLRRPAHMPEQSVNFEWSCDKQPRRTAAVAAWARNAAPPEVALGWLLPVPVDSVHRIRS